MLQKLRKRMQSEQGFTLIELLVVILIIGILAAIALPAFLNQRGKAYDANSKSAVKTAQTAMETYGTDNNGDFSAATMAKLQAIEPTLTNAPVPVLNPAPTATGYTIVATSTGPSSGAVTFTLTSNAGAVSRTCAPVNTGGCNAAGTW